jgi:glycosyltransferase involved in cell wall biosynthesis
MMRVAHMTVVTPGRCGLYETTRELVANLRTLGIDSRLVDPTRDTNKLHPGGDEDRGALFGSMDWAVGCDLIVNHSGYDNTPLEKSQQPVVHIAHGRPRSSFISESKGSTPIYSYWYAKSKDPRFAAVVTFWPQHAPYLQVMFPDKPVHVVQSSVDLDAWSPNGPAGYQFHGKRGAYNLVLTDAWRDDLDPFVPLNAAALFARELKGTKIHIYARPASAQKGWNAILKRIHDDGNLGEVCGWTQGLANVYRAATLMVTPQEIDTRSVREAMACGCPVVRMQNLDNWRDGMFAGLMTSREGVRIAAQANFDPKRTAEQFADVLKRAMPKVATLKVA